MISKLYFFDIPIYRTSKVRHYSEMEKQKQKKKKYWLNLWAKQGYDLSKIQKAVNFLDHSLNKSLLYSWEFNEIIGWIRLYVWSKQIRGDAWFKNSRKIVTKSKGEFEYIGNVVNLFPSSGESNNGILVRLLNCLDSLHNESRFKNRYIDVDLLENTGRFINWKKLVGVRKRKKMWPRPHLT